MSCVFAQVKAQSTTGNVISIPIEARITEYRGVSKHTGYYIGGFQPGYIEVHAGQRVTLILTSKDGYHSLEIPELGEVSETVGPGESTQLTFVARQVGSFDIQCHTRCGELHKKMTGRLVVLPSAEEADPE
jgi:heme/copper-type cytochrome/quinol oxidase subunit 2